MSKIKDELKNKFTGEIILPEDSSYTELSKVMMKQGKPAVIFQPLLNEDVAVAIKYAKDNSLLLSIKSGGHSNAGQSTNDGGIVVDLVHFDQIEIIDNDKKIVRVGSGVRWGDVAKVLQEHGLVISSGDTKSVGVGGLTLGAGVGWLVRKVGLAIDSLIGAEIVTADGKTLHLSADENPDLFWAIRGGGGNFGVVTTFEFTAYPLKKVYSGSIIYKIEDRKEILKGWGDYMKTAPEELNSTMMVLPSFMGNPPSVMILVCYAGEDEVEAMNNIEPLLKLGEIVQKDIKEKPYAEVLEEAHPPQGVKIIVNNGFVKNFSDELIELIVQNYGNVTSPVLQIRSLGGAMKRIPSDATAFFHRDSEALLIDATFAQINSTDEELKIATKPWETIKPFTEGGYINFFSEAEEKQVKTAYPGEVYKKLAEIKRRYDPENIFNQNYNIKPE